MEAQVNGLVTSLAEDAEDPNKKRICLAEALDAAIQESYKNFKFFMDTSLEMKVEERSSCLMNLLFSSHRYFLQLLAIYKWSVDGASSEISSINAKCVEAFNCEEKWNENFRDTANELFGITCRLNHSAVPFLNIATASEVLQGDYFRLPRVIDDIGEAETDPDILPDATMNEMIQSSVSSYLLKTALPIQLENIEIKQGRVIIKLPGNCKVILQPFFGHVDSIMCPTMWQVISFRSVLKFGEGPSQIVDIFNEKIVRIAEKSSLSFLLDASVNINKSIVLDYVCDMIKSHFRDGILIADWIGMGILEYQEGSHLTLGYWSYPVMDTEERNIALKQFYQVKFNINEDTSTSFFPLRVTHVPSLRTRFNHSFPPDVDLECCIKDFLKELALYRRSDLLRQFYDLVKLMRNDTEFNLDERNKVSCVLFNLHIAAYESGKILSLPVKVVASVSGELKLCVPRNYLFYDKHGGMSHSQFRKLYLDVLSKSLTYISMCIHNRKLVETANSVGKFSRQLDKLCSEMKQRNSDFWDEQNII